MGRAQIHPGCGSLRSQQHPELRVLQRAEPQPGSVRNVPCSVSTALVPREGRDPFPFTAGSPGRVCCHRLHFVVAISTVSVSALHAGLPLFQGCVQMYDPFLLQGNKAGLLSWFPLSPPLPFFLPFLSLLPLPPSFLFPFPPLSSPFSPPHPLAVLALPLSLSPICLLHPFMALMPQNPQLEQFQEPQLLFNPVPALGFIPQPEPAVFSAL